jgi:coenzyme F420-reducing hydrogenase delta subunit/DNA-binding transcriptional ArsR family regulator
MCTGRVDLSFILRAFSQGADGVFIGGCWPGECHYITEGNFDALSNVHVSRKLMEHIGLEPERLRIEWISASEGSRYAEVMNDFVKKLKEFGPLGKACGMEEKEVKLKLKAVENLIPYIKLVERERLRIPVKTEEAYGEFYASDESSRLFSELIADKLTIGQIMLLLKENPLSTGELSEILSLEPSEISRHLNSSARQGLVRYDEDLKSYALAASARKCDAGPGLI